MADNDNSILGQQAFSVVRPGIIRPGINQERAAPQGHRLRVRLVEPAKEQAGDRVTKDIVQGVF